MRKYRFQNRLVLVSITALIGITSLLFTFFAAYYISENNKQFVKSTNQNCEAAANILEHYMFVADNAAIQLTNNPYVKEMFAALYFNDGDGNYFEQEHIEANQIVQYLMPYLVKTDGLYRICIYNQNGDFLNAGFSVTKDGIQKYLNPERMGQVAAILEANKNIKAYMIYPEDILQNHKYKDHAYLSFVRPVRDSNVNHGKTLGYLEIHLSLNALKKQLSELNVDGEIELQKDGHTFLRTGEYLESYNNYTAIYESGDGFAVKIKGHDIGGRRVVFTTIGSLSILLGLIIVSMFLIQKRMIKQITKPLISLFEDVKNTDFAEMESLESVYIIDEIQEFRKLLIICFKA